MVFVRKKKINGREYHYVVKSTRIGQNKWKKIERYVGINPPSQEDLNDFGNEFDRTKDFLASKEQILEKIRRSNLKKLKNATKDEFFSFEENVITKFTYDTNRIEGSSLTYKDTKMLLEEGITPNEKPIRDIKEAENHREAYYYMKNNLKHDINAKLILELHRILKRNVTEDAGKFRDANVIVGDLVPIKPDMIKIEIKNLLVWYNRNKAKLQPLEIAVVFHSIFERIHPFFDGNGRVGRLLLNFIMLKNNFPLIIVQNKNKRRYYNALKHADTGKYIYLIKYLFSEMEKQDKLFYN